jgi:hypothetical protein
MPRSAPAAIRSQPDAVLHFPDTTLLGHVYDADGTYAPCIQSFTQSPLRCGLLIW